MVLHFLNIVGIAKDRGRHAHWDNYYLQSSAPLKPSPFAQSVLTDIKSGNTLLEIGSGNGRDASFFSSNGIKVFAIDRSQAAIQICKDRHSNLSAKFFVGVLSDVYNQLSKIKFDIVFSRFVLHAMPLSEEIETLSICNKLMKTGAKIYIECRSINDPLARKGEIISETERIDGHYRRFIIIDELKDRLSTAGFKVLDAIESDGLATFKDDNPVVIRIIAEKLPNSNHLVFISNIKSIDYA